MINLSQLVGLYVDVKIRNGEMHSGYVEAFCAADDNDDFEPDEREDGICLTIDDGGGVFLLLSQIESITVHNSEAI